MGAETIYVGGLGSQAYNLLGYSYRSLTPPDMGNALASYQLALSKNPDHCGVYEYLGAYRQCNPSSVQSTISGQCNVRC